MIGSYKLFQTLDFNLYEHIRFGNEGLWGLCLGLKVHEGATFFTSLGLKVQGK
jgi:hypothetical protein